MRKLQIKHTNIWLIILLLSCITACSQVNNTKSLYMNPGFIFPYQLAEPVKTWKLPGSLQEISGVSFMEDHRLACIQDEKGIIFIFNLKTGEVESEIIFGDDDDYEDIAIINNDAWILKSNGTLFEVKNYRQEASPTINKYPTALTRKNDTEGLAYDPVNNNLLLACKEQPYLDKNEGPGYRAIYSFNLENKQLELSPFLLIKLDTISYHQGGDTFKPSAIAVHPVSGDLFILASAGNLMLVLSGKGEMQALIRLDPKIYNQPEGICFSPDGTLYISNEGDGLSGTLLKFEPKDK